MDDKKFSLYSQWKEWLGIATSVSQTLKYMEQATAEFKKLEIVLTEIAKTTDLTASQLKSLTRNSFDVAGKLGKNASEYLKSVHELKMAGYENYEAMAQLSLVAQSSGNMTRQMANDYLTAADAALKYHGNTEKLNALLDGQTQIAKRNSISMTELASATKTAMNNFVDIDIPEDKLTALLGTGISSSSKSGEDVAKSIKSIIMELQQTEGIGGNDNEIISERTLDQVKNRCRLIGIELNSVQEGSSQLRDPVNILGQLAQVYNSLPDGSSAKSGILSDIGGKYNSDVLSSLLSNWSQYEKMLSDYGNSQGTAVNQANQKAEAWSGIFNSISNNWTSLLSSLSDDSTFLSLLKILENLTSGATYLVQSLGGFPAIIAVVSGALASKNFGMHKSVPQSYCFEYALHA